MKSLLSVACCLFAFCFFTTAQEITFKTGATFGEGKVIESVIGELDGHLFLLLRDPSESHLIKDFSIAEIDLATLAPLRVSDFEWEKVGKFRPYFERAFLDHGQIILIKRTNVEENGQYVKAYLKDTMTPEGILIRSNEVVKSPFEWVVPQKSGSVKTAHRIVESKSILAISSLDADGKEVSTRDVVIQEAMAPETKYYNLYRIDSSHVAVVYQNATETDGATTVKAMEFCYVNVHSGEIRRKKVVDINSTEPIRLHRTEDYFALWFLTGLSAGTHITGFASTAVSLNGPESVTLYRSPDPLAVSTNKFYQDSLKAEIKDSGINKYYPPEGAKRNDFMYCATDAAGTSYYGIEEIVWQHERLSSIDQPKRKIFYYRDVTFLRIDSTGHSSVAGKLHKHQHSLEDEGSYSGYATFPEQDALIVVYNIVSEATGSFGELKTIGHRARQGKFRSVNVAMFDAAGNYHDLPVKDPAISNLDFFPRVAHTSKAGQYLLFACDEDALRLVEVLPVK